MVTEAASAMVVTGEVAQGRGLGSVWLCVNGMVRREIGTRQNEFVLRQFRVIELRILRHTWSPYACIHVCVCVNGGVQTSGRYIDIMHYIIYCRSSKAPHFT